jgi:DNA-binding transcriptional LysR family regulator
MIENFRIRVFRTVAHHLNFSRAAEELLLTQPAVTQQVKTLEDQLGVSLFDRGGGRIELTPGGIALLPFAEKMKTLEDEAIAAVAGAYGEHAGELSIGASQTIGQYLLPRFIAAFGKTHPEVRITARSGNTDQMLEALVAGDIQIALIEGPERRRDVHIEAFMEDQLVLVVPASHGWANQELDLEDLRTEPVLMREFGSGTRRIIESCLTKAGLKIKELSPGMEFDSNEALLNAVEAGLGYTFVSRWAVRNQLALGTLKLSKVKGLKLTRSFSMAYPAGPEPTGSVGAFRGFLLALSPQLTKSFAKTRAGELPGAASGKP